MDDNYQRFRKDELILRDELAIDRTLLANERTLLAYLRGGLTLLLVGVTFIHFSNQGWFMALGVLCLPAGAAVLAFGTWRYRKMDRSIRILRERDTATPALAPDAASREPRP